MTDAPFPFETIPWRRIAPWLHLTRAFWIAVDFRKLFLASAGLLLVSAGSLVFDRLPFGQMRPDEEFETVPDNPRWPWQWSLGYRVPTGRNALAEFRGVLDHPGQTVVAALTNWEIVLHPLRAMSEPAARIFRGYSSWAVVADSVTRLAWALIVWSVIGGAITRIAAVQFARHERVGLWAALRFSLSRFFGYLSAPALPLAGVGALWLLCVIGGWLGRIPGGAGETVLGVLWGLELIFGLMMAVVLVGLATGWPLMFATIGVEGTDGFDGLSRMYNYVFERPLYYIWQIGVALVYGSAAIFFVWLMAQLLVHLAVWGVSWGMGYGAVSRLLAGAPEMVVGGMREFGDGSVEPAGGLGGTIVRGWMCVLATLLAGFVYSYFWTSSTIIYFTLRRSVDANDMDEVYLETEPEQDDLLPLVGAAGMGETAQLAPVGADRPSEEESAPVDLAP